MGTRPKSKSKPLVVMYRRVSTDTQESSLDIQLQNIKAFCLRNNYKCIKDFTDEDVSGTLDITERPGMLQLLSFCRKHNGNGSGGNSAEDIIQFVIIDKVDRFSRNLGEQLYVEKELAKCNIRILYATQDSLNGTGDECADMMADAMRKMMGVISEIEVRMIKQRLAAGIKKKLSNGNKATGRQPFGYMYDENKYRTIVNEAEAEIVRKIFDMRSSGIPYGQIAEYMNKTITPEQRKGFCKSNQHRKWTKQSVAVVVKNDYYYGIVTYDGVKTKGNHEMIIGEDVWVAANQRMNFGCVYGGGIGTIEQVA